MNCETPYRLGKHFTLDWSPFVNIFLQITHLKHVRKSEWVSYKYIAKLLFKIWILLKKEESRYFLSFYW